MKIVVYPHQLDIGGSQINAIDLGAAVRDLGHEVIIYGLPGALESYIATKKLRYVPAHRFAYRCGVSHIAQLTRLVRREKIDVVHAYEWPPSLDAFFGPGLLLRVPVVCTILSMSVMDIVPRVLPLIMGTEALAEEARLTQRGAVSVMEPPIDTEGDTPANDGREFRLIHGIAREELLVVTVSRLSIDLKLDALVDAIEAAGHLASSWPVRLVLVGDGEAAAQLRARAAAVNERCGREVVIFAGAMLDPRPAYAAADIVVGMGGSAIRAMAHGKPVVVQGERGFNAPFDPDHEAFFFQNGFYGWGDGGPGGARLAEYIAGLLAHPEERAFLGARGRETAVRRYSLQAAAAWLVCRYQEAIDCRPRRRSMLRDAARSAALRFEAEVIRPGSAVTTRDRQMSRAQPAGAAPLCELERHI